MKDLKNLRRNFERFCYQHRSKGIPNLMLYISIGAALVYIMSMVDKSNTLYNALCFDRALILQGQVWRLFTYVFTYNAGNVLFMFISLLCYFTLGRAMENIWGTFRFNLFYFTGVVLMDIFCMIFGGFRADVYYLNMSLFLGYATLYPDAGFLLFYIIPVKAWIFALLDLVLTLVEVIQLTAAGLFPYNLFPLIAIANYFLFFGKDVVNVVPLTWRLNARRLFKKNPKQKTGTVPFPTAGSYQATTASVKAPYTHKCTVCGRTDVTNPELEFRYCSRCNGYHCYCEDHINNHTHIQ
jgi:membrane associated rhomboid family serine protease